MSESQAIEQRILFANEAFYAAFTTGDVSAMSKAWVSSYPIVCLHPGARPIFDRDEMMDSWTDILSDPGVAELTFHSPSVVLVGNTALVTGYECFGDSALAASNGFVLESGIWRMFSHHAGPCHDAPSAPDQDQTTNAIH